MSAVSWADRIKTANNIRPTTKQLVWWWNWSSDNNEYLYAMLHGPMPLVAHTHFFPPKVPEWWWKWSWIHNESQYIKVAGPMTQRDYANYCWESAETAWSIIKPSANTGLYRF